MNALIPKTRVRRKGKEPTVTAPSGMQGTSKGKADSRFVACFGCKELVHHDVIA